MLSLASACLQASLQRLSPNRAWCSGCISSGVRSSDSCLFPFVGAPGAEEAKAREQLSPELRLLNKSPDSAGSRSSECNYSHTLVVGWCTCWRCGGGCLAHGEPASMSSGSGLLVTPGAQGSMSLQSVCTTGESAGGQAPQHSAPSTQVSGPGLRGGQEGGEAAGRE